MKINLPNNISSLQDLKSLIMEVRGYARWYSAESIKSKVSGPAPVAGGFTVSETAASLIKTAVSDQGLNQKALDELISSLTALENTAPKVTVTLAGVPSGSLKKSMVDWFRNNLAPEILVDFKFNATILGGMVVQYGSHIYDWSFRRSILSNRSKFPEVLRHVR